MKKKTYSTYEVFTPSSPAFLTFVERNEIDAKLDRAMKTIGKQVILYGHSGSGKTSLIQNYLTTNNLNKIITQCSNEMAIEEVLLDAFNQLDIYYKETIESNTGDKIGGNLSASFLGMKASLNAEQNQNDKEVLKKMVSVQLTPPTLAKYLGLANCCWIIEDFHKILKSDKNKLSQIMKVFMDASINFPKLKIVTIGAVNTAREIIQYDKEMKNRVAEIHVQLMDSKKLNSIITTGEKLLNIKFDNSVKDRIISFSCGLPSVTHNLCLLICEENKINETSVLDKRFSFNTVDLKKAVNTFISDNEDTYKSIYEKATYTKIQRKYENPKELLFAMINTKNEEIEIQEIINLLKLKHPNYKSNNLKNYLDELTSIERDEVLRYHKATNSYYFSNPFFKSYVATKQHEEFESVKLNKRKIVKNMGDYLDSLSLAKMQFLKDFEVFEGDFETNYDEDDDEFKSILNNKLTSLTLE
jgi:Holliday junction resolvasome RuvABC ATP-dependent DNA helicase subunit